MINKSEVNHSFLSNRKTAYRQILLQILNESKRIKRINLSEFSDSFRGSKI